MPDRMQKYVTLTRQVADKRRAEERGPDAKWACTQPHAGGRREPRIGEPTCG